MNQVTVQLTYFFLTLLSTEIADKDEMNVVQ